MMDEEEHMLFSELSIASWNIDGYKNKIDNPEFLDQIKQHHIIFCSETHSNDNSFQIEGYKAKNVCFQEKSKKRGKTPYGISVLTKNNLCKFVTVVQVTAKHFIWVKISKKLTGYPADIYCCGVYMPPEGSVYYRRRPDTNLFDSLNSDILKFNQLGDVMISGDLNSHVGTKADTFTKNEVADHLNLLPGQDFIEISPRCSMDTKVCAFGNNLLDLCFAHDMCILNGRTIGDTIGDYTFIGYKGNSVIDYTIVNKQLLPKILVFKVHEFNVLSNHKKIETILGCTPTLLSKPKCVTDSICFDKFSWNANTSPGKLNQVLQSQEFVDMKKHILDSQYASNTSGVNKLSSDVESLTKLLHEKCCDKSRVGRKTNNNKSKRKPWFNLDCQSLRKRVRRAANYLGRNPNNRQARDEYFSARRKYNSLVKKMKKQHRNSEINKLINASDHNEMWSLLSKLKSKKSATPIDMAELHSHFEELLNTPQKHISPERLQFLCGKLSSFLDESAPADPLLEIGNYSTSLITKLAKNLKNGKSAFIDGSINETIKYSITDMVDIYQKLFNHLEASAVFPSSWKGSFLVPLHKKGSPSDPNNYRGLAVGNNVSKFYTKILNDKLKRYCDLKSILSPQQFGFRDDFRTTDSIFVLRSVISYYNNHSKKPVFACFVDFSMAFDSVDRTALFYKLGSMGIKGNILKLIINMYTDSTYRLKCNGVYSLPLQCKLGVKQGCNLSPHAV